MTVLVGTLTTGSAAYAAVDPNAHHVAGEVRDRKFTAFLTPFGCEADARTALEAEGATGIALLRKAVRHG